MTQSDFEEMLHFLKVGRCVNGVAHDVNNCLGAMLAYSELASLDPNVPAEPRRMIGKVIEAVDRASKLISELTNIARPLRAGQGLIDFHQLLEGVSLLREYDFRLAQIVVERDVDATIPSIGGDLPRLRRALLYLVLNAEEALHGVDGRVLRIGAHNRGTHAEISLWNSGPPVEEALREKIFEPFFTTKGSDHLGLGLSVARSVAEAHHGTLIYTPEQGFTLSLPYAVPAP